MRDQIALRVVMTKRVASKYIAAHAQTGKTLTVYFSDDRTMKSFIRKAKGLEKSSSVIVTENFDYATFLSTDMEAIEEIQTKASELGLDFTDM